jgi:hypothetical protein
MLTHCSSKRPVAIKCLWLTNSKRANKDAKDICIPSFLNGRVTAHQKFIRLCRLKGGLSRRGIISMNLEAARKRWCCLSKVYEGSGNRRIQESLGGSKVGLSARDSIPRRKELE